MRNRRALINLSEAQKLYGKESTTFARPRYVPEGACEWCARPITNKRRTSCCSKECDKKFKEATSAIMYANAGSASGYRNHIFRRDNYTCQACGAPHYGINENNIPIPTTDGSLDLHHIMPVSEGGMDEPSNLVTLCRKCHKDWHKKHRADY